MKVLRYLLLCISCVARALEVEAAASLGHEPNRLLLSDVSFLQKALLYQMSIIGSKELTPATEGLCFIIPKMTFLILCLTQSICELTNCMEQSP